MSETIVDVSKASPDTSKKIQNYERVMKEMKKQIAGQKSEIQ